ncbi:MAG: imidazolonepropionase, partial [Candidatus Marinimicrobia bacterium]|nr:imidazolonepropionase [Candidatus Neomarinimicrobiota bacterium]
MNKILIKNIGELLTGKDGSLEILHDKELLISDGKIESAGNTGEFSEEGCEIIDAENSLVTPGLVDPHTHLIFFGTREDEFEMRIKGASYMEIAGSGGGIRKSVRMLREASEDDLVEHSLPYLKNMLKYGTTTVEVKSGYGLSLKDELKSLRAIKRLDEMSKIDLVPTFLGAHE